MTKNTGFTKSSLENSLKNNSYSIQQMPQKKKIGRNPISKIIHCNMQYLNRNLQTWKETEKRLQKQNRISKNCGQPLKV